MNKYDLKKQFLEERPRLNQYLAKIDFSLNQVISIEVLALFLDPRERISLATRRFIFKGMGFVFNVDTDDDYSFFKPELKFNEIQIEAQAG